MKNLFVFIIKTYQKFPIFDNTLSHILLGPGTPCRFVPRCSDYAIDAIQKYGIFKGTTLAITRILRCNPYSKGGLDPVK